MKKEGFYFILSIVLSVFLIVNASAAISCSNINQIIMKISSEENAHASLWNKGSYDVEVCSPIGQNIDRGNNAVLWLSSEENAHASITEHGSYTNAVYFGNQLNCSAKSDCDISFSFI